MKIRTREPTTHERWAQLRFSVVGQLLAAPPGRGDLQRELARLAATKWRDPVTGVPTTFGVSTIERWYYEARNAPVGSGRPTPAEGPQGSWLPDRDHGRARAGDPRTV